MKIVTKNYPINDNYFAVVEIDDDRVLIWIAENYKWFFGLFSNERRVSEIKLFRLSEDKDERTSCMLEGIFNGRHNRLPINNRNIDTFNVKKEIDIVYKSYTASARRRAEINRK